MALFRPRVAHSANRAIVAAIEIVLRVKRENVPTCFPRDGTDALVNRVKRVNFVEPAQSESLGGETIKKSGNDNQCRLRLATHAPALQRAKSRRLPSEPTTTRVRDQISLLLPHLATFRFNHRHDECPLRFAKQFG